MKPIKQLVLTSTLTLALCASLLPCTAQPLANEDNLHLTSYIVQKTNAASLPSKLTLSSPIELTEGFQRQIDVINNRNEFFEAAVIFNDKLQQVISFFSFPESESEASIPECKAS